MIPSEARSRAVGFGPFEFDAEARQLFKRGIRLKLQPQPARILALLIRHAGQVVTRQQLLDAVWGFDFEPGSNVVDVYVGYLRRKLDRPDGPSAIETVRGAGYLLAGEAE